MMRNTRGANADRNKRGLPSTRVYEFFTDTTRDPDNPDGFKFNFGLDIVETILCRSLAECRIESEGGIIPDNRQESRTPSREELLLRGRLLPFLSASKTGRRNGPGRIATTTICASSSVVLQARKSAAPCASSAEMSHAVQAALAGAGPAVRHRLAKQTRSVGSADERVDQVLGMRHHAEHVETGGNRSPAIAFSEPLQLASSVIAPCASQ